MSVHGGSTTNISPDGERILRKNFKKRLSEISITGNKITQDPDNQSKKANVGSSIDGTKIPVELMSENRSLSSIYVHGEIITTVSQDGERIPRKKGKNKPSEISITGNKITQDPDNQSKKLKLGGSIDGTKIHV